MRGAELEKSRSQLFNPGPVGVAAWWGKWLGWRWDFSGDDVAW